MDKDTPMRYRTLGNSGVVVSTFALGTMTFGAETGETTAHAILGDYVGAGGNLVDTADVYSSGVSEEIIGRWLAAHPTEREQVVIATKGRFGMGDGRNDLGTSRRHLGRALDASLRRLGVDQIDLYQMHAWDAVTPLEETLRFLDDAVRNGKIAYYGFSNFLGWQLTKAVHLARVRDRASLYGREHRFAPLVAVSGRLAHRQVPARHGPHGSHAPGRGPQTRNGGVGTSQQAGTDMADP
jgi:aryl-alcohol dehydrogenase-like predicted oxidoreductase